MSDKTSFIILSEVGAEIMTSLKVDPEAQTITLYQDDASDQFEMAITLTFADFDNIASFVVLSRMAHDMNKANPSL